MYKNVFTAENEPFTPQSEVTKMNVIHAAIYLFWFVVCTFCANSFPLVAANISTLSVIIPLFVALNLLSGVFSIKTRCVRLRICHHGATALAVFLPSACLSVIFHIVRAFILLPDEPREWFFFALYTFSAYFILFWNGIICVYLTSVQLGVKQRVVGALCGLIPVANLFCLVKIIKTTLREVNTEVKHEKINTDRAHLRVCATKYPILLVHGVCFRDSKLLNYWGRIPHELEQNGARVFYGNHRSAASIAVCAEELTARVREILAKTGAEKVNIIAHSKGGLDCRYAIAKLGMAPYVASFTTINSPHKGCQYADTLLTVIPKHIRDKVGRTYDKAMRHLGDIDPDFLAAMSNLTASFCSALADELDDATEKHGIYRQSIGSVMANAKAGMFPLNFFYHIVNEFDGPNDGLVSENSFEFGEKFTMLRPLTDRGISHMDVIDLSRKDIPGFDVREFYVDLVCDLKDRGY